MRPKEESPPPNIISAGFLDMRQSSSRGRKTNKQRKQKYKIPDSGSGTSVYLGGAGRLSSILVSHHLKQNWKGADISSLGVPGSELAVSFADTKQNKTNEIKQNPS